jgi:hypothetical protein
VVIYTDFDMLLYGMGIILLFIGALRYLRMARKKENPNEKVINRAFGLVLIGFTIKISLYVLFFLSLEGYHMDHSYKVNLELENFSLLSEWLYKGTYIIWYTLVAIFVRAVEKIRNKKIPVGAILGIISFFLAIFQPFEMFLIIGAIPWIITILYYFHVLFTLMKWAKKELKAATSFIILGSLLISNCMAFAHPNIMMAGTMPSILLPLLIILGAILNVAPTNLNPKFFSRSMNYWYTFFAGVYGYIVFMIVFQIIVNVPVFVINGVISLIFISVESVFFLKSLLKEEGASTKKSVDVIGVFTRPEIITEEEVSVSKEKKVCLVCKGKLGRNNIYLCPDCDTFYCKNCSEALSDMENACWACNSPIDPSKPVKSFEKEEEEVEVEEIAPKKVGGDTK